MPLVDFVTDSYVELAEIDIGRLPIGYQLTDVNGTSWGLADSNAVVDHVTVESVLGHPELRWLVSQGSSAPWLLNGAEVFASPEGDDASDGSSWQKAKGTGYAAAKLLTDAAINNGTGTLHLAEGTPWGGPVLNQGMWFRGDGFNVPGFLPKVAMRIVMHGRTSPVLFGQPAVGEFEGPVNGDRTKPAVWIVGGGGAKPMIFENVKTPGFLWVPYAIGVDFDRNNDGSLRQLTVSSASRASGSTTLTLTLPTGATIIDAKRVGTTVTARLAWPNGTYFAPNVGSLVRVVTGDANFPSIDAVVTALSSDVTYSNDGVIISYTQAGSAIGFTPVTGGTLASHCCQVGDRIEFLSNSSEFPTTMYGRITAATITTITVPDVYGYSPRTATVTVSNPGTIVRHERGRLWYNGDRFRNCTGQIQQGSSTEIFGVGPFVNAGASTAVPVYFEDCQLFGYQWDNHNGAFSDKDRGAAFLLDGGQQTAIVSAICRDITVAGGGMRAYSSQDGIQVDVDGWIQEGVGGFSPPAVEFVNGDNNTYGRVRRAFLADVGDDTPCVQVYRGIPAINIAVDQCLPATVGGAAQCRTMLATPNTDNPWVGNQQGTWPRGLTTPHAGINRQFGPVMTRWQNLVQAPASWNGGSPPSFSLVAAPDGTTTAVEFTPGGFTEITVVSTPQTAAVGDRIAAGVWVDFDGGNEGVGIFFGGFSNPSMTFDNGTNVSNASNFHQAKGWQWVSVANTVTAAGDGNWTAKLRFTIPGKTRFWAPTVILVPAAVENNDAWEAIRNLKHQSRYMAAGMTGTMEGQPFFAHGGLGVDSSIFKVAGAGSGQLTIGSDYGYMPIRDATGAIVCWILAKNASVNP